MDSLTSGETCNRGIPSAKPAEEIVRHFQPNGAPPLGRPALFFERKQTMKIKTYKAPFGDGVFYSD